MNTKNILGAVYSLRTEGSVASSDEIARKGGFTPEEIRKVLRRMLRERLLERRGQGFQLTPQGRRKVRVVMIGGAFEIIHPGHIHTVREAKKLGDVLVVVVARDKTVSKNKGRNPITREDLRVELVSSIKNVDAAVLGGEGSIYDTLERVRPDIVALGYDQSHREEEI
ncbi:MAG: adenylyltransferase/cytidyltransferase family protein, partial [Thaumarchaeota archaeon]|nr:adenylyltransferase/cytidyltransferase family protein [Nitrososphaerota archaeon]